MHLKESARAMELLRDLLQDKLLGSQEALRKELQNHNIQVNQSTISRLLHKLGAVKIQNSAGEIVYTLPSSASSESTLAQLIIDVAHNGQIIVIHTKPGSAGLVASFLDQTKNLPILGTLAGDDTVFIVPTNLEKISTVIDYLKEFV